MWGKRPSQPNGQAPAGFDPVLIMGREEVWAEELEDDGSSSGDQGGTGLADDRQRWAASAEAASMPKGEAPLWADPQFHVLQMQPDARLIPAM